ncbi:MAG: class I SAM-dependent methyltransferase [Methylicorpusculum sp.]|uniref:class I SAM-dependent methyltransferase n=1 Tax=Methylicorpusculum sp. TaxID=2713644 RepID=UPI00271B3F1A|nr:class I SAM-dependent methyltransferase [Methylicorpusculum sp.]MDO8938535.1 class I SAM-dependent methyltransferase [Methylicorpusculum sp.]MDP2202085.1 class I SAM-dependent methyltransferase [Methylicorpusculum sp.]
MKQYIYNENELPTPQNNKLLNLVGINKEVLEIGCAMGFQTKSMHKIQNCKVTGIEIDKNAAEYAKPYCENLYIGDIESLELESIIGNKVFDVITFADVLEHLYNPKNVLKKVRPFIKEGGYIVASIPNITHCSVIYEMAQGEFKYRNLGLLDDTHIRFFTRQSIYHTFEEAGYLITSLSRNIVKEIDTEFNTRTETDEDILFINYIKQRNPEAETYQFIIKAIPLDNTNGIQSELVEAINKLELLSKNKIINEHKIRHLESNISWMTSRISYRIFSYFKRLLKK